MKSLNATVTNNSPKALRTAAETLIRLADMAEKGALVDITGGLVMQEVGCEQSWAQRFEVRSNLTVTVDTRTR